MLCNTWLVIFLKISDCGYPTISVVGETQSHPHKEVNESLENLCFVVCYPVLASDKNICQDKVHDTNDTLLVTTGCLFICLNSIV